MNILYIGGFAPKELSEKYPKYGLDKYKYEEYIVKCLKKKNDVHLSTITSPELIAYPKLPILFLKSKKCESSIFLVSSLNIHFIKLIWKIIALFKAATIIIHKENIEYVIIPYMTFPYVLVTYILKFLYSNTRFCCIIPDIFFPAKNHKIQYFLNRITEKMIKKNDYFVLYTDSMADYLQLREKKYIIAEGFLDTTIIENLPVNKNTNTNKHKTIIYAGTLQFEYGIMRLIESMKYLYDDDIILYLYGNGNALSEIVNASKKDSRIKYMGWFAKEKMIEVLQEADVLVNPRCSSDGVYTQYSCPSKILEYLLSGVPSVVCYLPGVPQEYYNYLIVAEDQTPKSLAIALKIGLDMDIKEKEERGIRGREFVIKRVGIESQCNRIIELLKS